MTDLSWQREVRESRAYFRLKRRRRAQARRLARKGNVWSITARLYMAGCVRLANLDCGAERPAVIDAMVTRLDRLWRRMDAPELERVEAELRRGGEPWRSAP